MARAALASVVASTMSSSSIGSGWDLRRVHDGVRFADLLEHLHRCARDPDRGPWAAHRVLTLMAGAVRRRIRAVSPFAVRLGEGLDAAFGRQREQPEHDGVPGPSLSAGPPQAAGAFDPTHDLANLIANAESEGIAVTWCEVDLAIGGFVYRPPRRTGRRRDPRAAPSDLDARGLPSVTIGDLVVVLNPAQGWIETLELMLHELAHALLGHLGPAPSVRQAPDLIAVRERPPWDAREFEANAAAYVAALRRGDSAGRVGSLLAHHFTSLERDRALASVDLLQVFRAAEMLAAWCRIRAQSVGVLSTRGLRPSTPPAGASRSAEGWEELVPVGSRRSKVLV